MVAFVIGKPQRTKVPTVLVDAGLKPGTHRFRLVVVDDDGLESAPDDQLIVVQAGTGPVPLPPTPGAIRRRSNA